MFFIKNKSLLTTIKYSMCMLGYKQIFYGRIFILKKKKKIQKPMLIDKTNSPPKSEGFLGLKNLVKWAKWITNYLGSKSDITE